MLVMLYVYNPVDTPLFPKCMFRVVTGWSCPGCGMQRFLHAFMHGRILEAISYNYMLLFLFPYVLSFAIERLVLTGTMQQRWRAVIEGRTMTTAFCIIAPGWLILRNILHI